MERSFNEIEKALIDTNTLIDAMLEVVLPDFTKVTETLKRLGDPPTTPALARAYSAVVHELQYYDTLTQKMKHIIAIHELILTSAEQASQKSKPASGLNLIRLNHIQFQVGCFEYLSSVNEIETNLRILTSHYFGTTDSYRFQHSNLLLSASRLINNNFAMLEQWVREESEADLQGKVELVNTIYSMESERYVLRAYINKPFLHDGEIEPLHKSTNDKPEIELF